MIEKRKQKQFLWVRFDLKHSGPESRSPCSSRVITKLHEGCCTSLQPVHLVLSPWSDREAASFRLQDTGYSKIRVRTKVTTYVEVEVKCWSSKKLTAVQKARGRY